MVGAKEEHFAILEALKRLFQQFLQHSLHVAAKEYFYQKEGEKQKSFSLSAQLTAGACALCPCQLRRPCIMFLLFKSKCVYISLHHFYFFKSLTTNDSYMC